MNIGINGEKRMTKQEYKEYLYLKRKDKVCGLDDYELGRLCELENKKGEK